MKYLRHVAILCAAGLLSACASAPGNKPSDAITKADYAVQQAQDSDVKQQAPLYLYKANKKLKAAKTLANKNNATRADYTKARRLAHEAALDVKVAESQSKAKQAQAQADQVKEGVQSLKRQINRKESAQ